MKIVVLDFETTSVDHSRARVTEIGLVQLNGDFEIVAAFESVIKPPELLPVHKYSLMYSRLARKEVLSAPSFADLWPQIAPYLDGAVLVAHNMAFEMALLRSELREVNVAELPPFICTLELGREILGPKLGKYDLGSLCAYFDIDIESPHEAIQDATATSKLLKALSEKSPKVEMAITNVANQVHRVTLPEDSADLSPEPRSRFNKAILASSSLEDLVVRIESGLTQVIFTGSPATGKPGFAELLETVGLYNQETSPSRKTAFVIRFESGAGMSKINKAIAAGVPVISELQARELIGLLED